MMGLRAEPIAQVVTLHNCLQSCGRAYSAKLAQVFAASTKTTRTPLLVTCG